MKRIRLVLLAILAIFAVAGFVVAEDAAPAEAAEQTSVWSQALSTIVIGIAGAIVTALGVVLIQAARAITSWLNRTMNFIVSDARKAAIDGAVEAGVRSVQQTFVDGLKARAIDGKLTKQEAVAAAGKALDEVKLLLRLDGITDVGDVELETKIEAAVNRFAGAAG